MLSDHLPGVVGVLVAPTKDSFSWRTKTRAFLSGYGKHKIILTDKHDIISDMDYYINNKCSDRSFYTYVIDFIKISLLLFIAYYTYYK